MGYSSGGKKSLKKTLTDPRTEWNTCCVARFPKSIACFLEGHAVQCRQWTRDWPGIGRTEGDTEKYWGGARSGERTTSQKLPWEVEWELAVWKRRKEHSRKEAQKWMGSWGVGELLLREFVRHPRCVFRPGRERSKNEFPWGIRRRLGHIWTMNFTTRSPRCPL